MDFKKLLGNFSAALAAQGLNMLVGVLTTLLVPKVLGVTEFGYWQLFIFYASYVGCFHLGLADGVYLIEGGKTRETLDRRSVRSQYLFMLSYQVLFALGIVILALLGQFGSDQAFVLLMTAVFLLLNNAATYLGYVMQVINETKTFSASAAVNSVMFLVPLACMLALHTSDFRIYILFYCLARMVSLLFLALKCRSLLSVKGLPVDEAIRQGAHSIRVGVKLMVANASANLILGVSRFAIDASWGIEVFSYVSFALSMVTFFMMFISQASMVLFPALRRIGQGELKRFYCTVRDLLSLGMPVVYLLYAPAVWLLSLWLPQYQSSFALFALLLPLCLFDGKMNMLGNTYMKVLRKEGLLLKLNVSMMLLSLAFSCFFSFVARSYELVLISAVAVVVVRSCFTEWYLNRLFEDRGGIMAFEEVCLTLLFTASAVLLGSWQAWCVVAAGYVVYLIANRKRGAAALESLRSLGSEG